MQTLAESRFWFFEHALVSGVIDVMKLVGIWALGTFFAHD
jgi:hypothetical protein